MQLINLVVLPFELHKIWFFKQSKHLMLFCLISVICLNQNVLEPIIF